MGSDKADLIPAWLEGSLQPMDKIEVHRRGLRHPAVSVFLVSGDETLIQQRAAGKYHTPGLWANSCCTHPGWDEAASDCAVRRVAQELGITIGPPVFAGRVEYRADVGGGMMEHEMVDVFRAVVDRTVSVRPDPAEVMATEWIRLGDLRAALATDPGRFTPWLRIYLADHSGMIFGSGQTDG